jgi:TetR/AcrR family transcriptional regulator, fatty acid metabolism regulator protein
MQTTKHISTPSLKERQRQERVELIIQAAEDVLLEKGYYDASMDEIANRVGIAKATIYTHFPGKEELVLAIFRRDMQKDLRQIETLDGPTARATLEAIMEFIYTGIFSRRAHLMTSMYNGIDLKRLLMKQGGCIHELWSCMVVRVTELLEAGKRAGEFNQSIPTSAMVYSFLCTISPQAYEHYFLNSELTQAELVTYLQQIYFNGITHGTSIEKTPSTSV